MLSSINSAFQRYNNNKNIVVDFTPFSVEKENAQSLIHCIAQQIFEHFGCVENFNKTSIISFNDIYRASNCKAELKGLKPNGEVFSFLESLHVNTSKASNHTCYFVTDDFGSLQYIKITYSFVVTQNQELIKNQISLTYDNNFDLISIDYHRNNRKGVLFNQSRKRDMFCPLHEESVFIELFLSEHCEQLKEIFPEWYAAGVYPFSFLDIQENMDVARMFMI